MHQAGVVPAVIDHVTGHATVGETARYTKRSTLPQLQTAIETIGIGVNFSRLHANVSSYGTERKIPHQSEFGEAISAVAGP